MCRNLFSCILLEFFLFMFTLLFIDFSLFFNDFDLLLIKPITTYLFLSFWSQFIFSGFRHSFIFSILFWSTNLMKIKCLSQKIFHLRIFVSYYSVDIEDMLSDSAHFLDLLLIFFIMVVPFFGIPYPRLDMTYFLYNPFISFVNLSLFLQNLVLVEKSGLLFAFLLLLGPFWHKLDHSLAHPNTLQNFIQPLIFLFSKLVHLPLILIILVETKVELVIVLLRYVHGFAGLKQKLVMIFLILKFEKHASSAIASEVPIH